MTRIVEVEVRVRLRLAPDLRLRESEAIAAAVRQALNAQTRTSAKSPCNRAARDHALRLRHPRGKPFVRPLSAKFRKKARSVDLERGLKPRVHRRRLITALAIFSGLSVVGRPALPRVSSYTGVVAPSSGPTIASIAAVRSLLAFAAHPDDVESWCAGALALAADAGAAVRVIIATSGEAGNASIATPDLRTTREAEARGAAEILGIHEPIFLRLPDGGLAGREALVQQCRDAVARYLPDLILGFDPDRPWSGAAHTDHLAMGRAARVAAGDDVETWLFSTAAPNRHLDIGAVFERKVAARMAHRSQTVDPDRLRADWTERAHNAGVAVGLSCAEAFRKGR